MIGSQDLLVLLGIGVFFFGAKRLPELSRALGQAVSEFRKGVTGGTPDASADAEPRVGPEAARDEGARDGGGKGG